MRPSSVCSDPDSTPERYPSFFETFVDLKINPHRSNGLPNDAALTKNFTTLPIMSTDASIAN